MRNLKNHFNDRARQQRKREKARSDLDLVFFILWLLHFMAAERLDRERGHDARPPFTPG